MHRNQGNGQCQLVKLKGKESTLPKPHRLRTGLGSSPVQNEGSLPKKTEWMLVLQKQQTDVDLSLNKDDFVILPL